MLQADCGYCSYYRPQDESTTHKWLCSSSYISSQLFFFCQSCFVIYILPPPHTHTPSVLFIHLIILSSVFVLCFNLQPSLHPLPPIYFYLCLLLFLLLLFSCLNAQGYTHMHKCVHAHCISSLTHLSVICMRWFLMHLGPSGSSHSNLHQHPLPWL